MNFEELKGTGLSEKIAYIGTVVNNNCPRKLDRIQVRIATIYDGIEDNFLPWAIPTYNKDATINSGICDIPPIGAKVRIYFQEGSPDHPEYYPYLVDEQCVIKEKLSNYPHLKVRKFHNGTYVVLDTKTNELFVYHKGGNAQLDFENCDVILNIKGGNLLQTVEGNVRTKCTGDFLVEAGGSFSVKSSSTQIESSSTTIKSNTAIIGSLQNNGVNVGSSHTHRENDAAPNPTGGPQ